MARLERKRVEKTKRITQKQDQKCARKSGIYSTDFEAVDRSEASLSSRFWEERKSSSFRREYISKWEDVFRVSLQYNGDVTFGRKRTDILGRTLRNLREDEESVEKILFIGPNDAFERISVSDISVDYIFSKYCEGPKARRAFRHAFSRNWGMLCQSLSRFSIFIELKRKKGESAKNNLEVTNLLSTPPYPE